MPRTYIRKTKPPEYTKEDLESAVQAVKNGELTMYRAAKTYKIPKATIYKRVKGLRGVKSSSLGRAPALPHDVEEKIASGIKIMEKWGFGLSKKEVLETIGRYINANNIKTPFRNGIPGNDFFSRFKRDHNLSQKKPQAVEVARKRSMDPFIINSYFNLLKKNIQNIPASQIYNIDETSFCVDPARIKVVGERGTAAHRVTSGPGRENITVLFGGNAAGEKLPPLIVFRGKNVWDSWLSIKEGYPGMTYAASKNGWMDTQTFENYFQNNFLKNVCPERPVVLIYDGHNSHVGVSLVEMAMKQKVVILKLPAHSSHLLQPMDLAVFRPLKIMYDEELIKWQRRNYGHKLPKSEFASIISRIWRNANPAIIAKGFEKGGIHPFNNAVIPEEKFETGAYQRWRQSQEIGDNISNGGISIQQADVPQNEEHQTADNIFREVVTSNTVDPMPSTSSSILPTVVQENLSFETMLLEQLKQAPRTSSKRRRVCAGAEVITTQEALEKLKESRRGNTQTKKKAQEKNKANQGDDINDEQSSNDEIDRDQLPSDSEDDTNLEDEADEYNEENEFMGMLNKKCEELEKDDWILVKFASKKSFKCYVGQVTQANSELEATFARKIGSSNYFHFPVVADTSVFSLDQVIMILPKPILKRGKFTFNVSFDSLNVN
ncbi:hypothetical protein PPYR_13440 [Photinus pyralis]|uniref:HTH psq-type domain-containing protein n=2 Tax=Photinus pyralis TaxID=7054 RepID=A0A5N4A918_PHOPY|nr:uncharacterized protein LOC116179492 [Photinus pyralis]KAB0793820.1 hypothetical protein PPYR_13440 [Photinus pyralis]